MLPLNEDFVVIKHFSLHAVERTSFFTSKCGLTRVNRSLLRFLLAKLQFSKQLFEHVHKIMAEYLQIALKVVENEGGVLMTSFSLKTFEYH